MSIERSQLDENETCYLSWVEGCAVPFIIDVILRDEIGLSLILLVCDCIDQL